MNRAILVVICDFVVLSMLSLTSLSPAGAPGSAAGDGAGQHATLDASTSRAVLEQLQLQAKKLEELHRQLLQNQLKQGATPATQAELDKVSEELASARAQYKYLSGRLALTPEKLAELEPEQLKKLLEAESHNRELTIVRNEQLNSELAYIRNNYQVTSEQLSETTKQLAAMMERATATQSQLLETRETLSSKETALAALDQNLNQTRNELTATTTKLEEREQALTVTHQQLNTTVVELKQNKDTLEQRLNELSFTKGQLEATVRELDAAGRNLAESQARLELEKRTAQNKELELAELRRQLTDTRKILTSTANELTVAKNELKSSATQTANATAMLNDLKDQVTTTRDQLQQAEAQLKSDVSAQYATSVSKLHLSLRAQRMLVDHTQERDFFLPEIQLDGRRFLISELRLVSGFDRADIGDDVNVLQYANTLPTVAEDPERVTISQLFVPAADQRVALLETSGRAGKAMRPLTFPELVKRGPQELYLYKQRSFGTDSCALETRASLSMDPQDPYLYIRNSNRSATELRAEPGDFVISKQGDFVGVVVATETYDMGTKEEAKVFVFPAAPAFENAISINLTGTDAKGFHSEFSQGVRNLLGTMRKLDAVQRKR